MKRTILFDDEKLNYITTKGSINPITNESMIDYALKKYEAIGD